MSNLKKAQERFALATRVVCGLPANYDYQVGYGRCAASIADKATVVISRVTRLEFADDDFLLIGVVNGLIHEGKPLRDALCVAEPNEDEPTVGFLCNVSFVWTADIYDEMLARVKMILEVKEYD